MKDDDFLFFTSSVLDMIHFSRYALSSVATDQDRMLYWKQVERVKSQIERHYMELEQKQ